MRKKNAFTLSRFQLLESNSPTTARKPNGLSLILREVKSTCIEHSPIHNIKRNTFHPHECGDPTKCLLEDVSTKQLSALPGQHSPTLSDLHRYLVLKQHRSLLAGFWQTSLSGSILVFYTVTVLLENILMEYNRTENIVSKRYISQQYTEQIIYLT